MKLSPQLLVYDQDANRSRRFNTNVGGLLEFHYFMLYTVFPICGYMDCYLVLSQDLFITSQPETFVCIINSDGHKDAWTSVPLAHGMYL